VKARILAVYRLRTKISLTLSQRRGWACPGHPSREHGAARLADDSADNSAIATLEYAAMRDCEHTLLLESAHYRGKRRTAAEQFPAMVAEALRQIMADKSLQ
jgi:hypothetical protein